MSRPDYGRRRPVDGGLRARSTRGVIGQSWWSRRFLEVLESFALGTRLSRGRSYARAGQVLSLTVAAGRVTADVQGSRPRPYRVTLGLAPFAEPLWRQVETRLAAQALYSARLLAGDLPPELEELFTDAGAPLFPGSIGELDLTCDCPDFAVPCKHLAAVCYLLAEVFDADPFQILHWRGRERDQLLARLRGLRAGADAVVPEADQPAGLVGGGESPGRHTAVAPTAGAGLALTDLPQRGVAAALERFWLPPVPVPARTPVLDAEPDLVLRQLGPPAAILGGPGLVERLRPGYQRFGTLRDGCVSPDR